MVSSLSPGGLCRRQGVSHHHPSTRAVTRVHLRVSLQALQPGALMLTQCPGHVQLAAHKLAFLG